MRALVGSLIALAAVSAAPAVDISTCGQGVPAGENGVLQADLDCSGQPAGGEALWVGRNGTLDLAGHTLTGPPLQPNGYFGIAVRCRLTDDLCEPPGSVCVGRGRCTVTSNSGLGHVESGGIVSERHLVLSHVSVAGGFVAADYGTLTATDVSISGGGLVARSVKVQDVSVNGAPEFGVHGLKRVSGRNLMATNSGGAGVAAPRVSLDGLVATGNGAADYDGGGVYADSCSLRNSTVTANVINEDETLYPVDLFTSRRPRLEATTCDHSGILGDASVPTGTWGVCTLD